MKKSSFRLILSLMVLVVMLAACAGGGATPAGETTGGNVTGGGATPGGDTTGGTTGGDTTATEAPTDAAGGTGGAGGDAAANCAGVDTQQLITTGQTVYTENCAGCHGEQGQGQGNFPALAGDANITGEDVASVVQGYLAVEAHPKDLSADDLAAVLSYTRGSFGNTGSPVCPTDVQVPAGQ